jgi:hypothetical protein
MTDKIPEISFPSSFKNSNLGFPMLSSSANTNAANANSASSAANSANANSEKPYEPLVNFAGLGNFQPKGEISELIRNFIFEEKKRGAKNPVLEVGPGNFYTYFNKKEFELVIFGVLVDKNGNIIRQDGKKFKILKKSVFGAIVYEKELLVSMYLEVSKIFIAIYEVFSDAALYAEMQEEANKERAKARG